MKSRPRPTVSKKQPASKSFDVEQACILKDFLLESLKKESKTTIKSLLTHRQISVNGKTFTQYDTPLHPGDRVEICFGRNQTVFNHPMLKILYEDSELIVVNKASGLLSMSTGQDKENTAYRILSDYVKRGNPHSHIFILHRLDRETSGIMMFAKTLQTQDILQNNWDEMIRDRRYVAVVEGKPEMEAGTIKTYLAENSAYIVHKTNATEGKLAITNYQTLKSNREYSLLELELETGRKNQIRAHMQEINHPIAGDKKYGARTNPLRRVALHAFKLCFVHPSTRREMSFDTPIPGNFKQLVN